MFKVILCCLFVLSVCKGENDTVGGVVTKHTDSSGKTTSITVIREVNDKCNKIGISNDTFWIENYANISVPEACKSTFITTAGKTIFPMRIHNKIETYAEVEVLAFIEQMQKNNDMLLIDCRDEEWYDYRTIPGAINIHYLYLLEADIFTEEYHDALVTLGIKGITKPYDLRNAKTILLFCNGAWCSQSPKMIQALLDLGYPPEKIKWYRGGMDDWLGLSMTSTQKYSSK